MKSSPIKLKQKLSPEAKKAKHNRDVAMAKTDRRSAMKAQAQRIGQRSDSDIHHTNGKVGPTKRVPIKDNRGNYGRGTRTNKTK